LIFKVTLRSGTIVVSPFQLYHLINWK
jgi:hypothetical protein